MVVASAGGWIPFLLGAAVAFCVSKVGHAVYQHARRKTDGWLDACLRALSLRRGPLPKPRYIIDDDVADAIRTHAPDLQCGVFTHSLLVEPAELHGEIYERR